MRFPALLFNVKKQQYSFLQHNTNNYETAKTLRYVSGYVCRKKNLIKQRVDSATIGQTESDSHLNYH
ncbi:acetyltransferase [Candidatus Scalindua japonica]|uniref:Acetyltransferase n=1 Tax=Candidatus Scalindua japonica TaxID=1284222 RepID=A0A286TTS9_9BACT|nr:acetyltransferase [Candidatus Scalindua japonica]